MDERIARLRTHEKNIDRYQSLVCTENLSSGVVMVKSAKDGV